MLQIDTSRPLRKQADLVRLLEAILAGSPTDETDWVEWKSHLDLSTAHGRFKLAKEILGMANRLPAKSAMQFDGLGYVAVGLEPGRVEGLDQMDPAELDDRLRTYLGDVQPDWSDHWVPFRDRHVLIIVVEAPQPGDPIYSLQKTYDGAGDGMIYVRDKTKTRPANSAEISALQARLLGGRRRMLDLEVSLVRNFPLPWLEDPFEAARSRIDRRAEEMVTVARASHEHAGRPDRMPPAVGMFRFAALSTDTRTLKEYIDQVEKWKTSSYTGAADRLITAIAKERLGVVQIRVKNPTDRNIKGVEVKVKVDADGLIASPSLPVAPRGPTPPRPFGTPPQHLLGDVTDLVAPRLVESMPDLTSEVFARTWVEEGSVVLVFEVGDLRPFEEDESDAFFCLALEHPASGVFEASWQATSSDLDGVASGSILIPVAAAQLDLDRVLGSG